MCVQSLHALTVRVQPCATSQTRLRPETWLSFGFFFMPLISLVFSFLRVYALKKGKTKMGKLMKKEEEEEGGGGGKQNKIEKKEGRDKKGI